MRHRVPIAAALITIAGFGLWIRAHVPPTPRHVIIISIDTLRADQVGVYGNTVVHTPALDAFAGESVRFERAIAVVPSTLAGHVSMFTGQPPHTHGVPRNDYAVSEENVMLTELLAAQGFETAAFLGALPLGPHSGFTQGFEHVDEGYTLHKKRDKVEQSMRPANAVTDAVLVWLDHRENDRPIFAFVHYYDVHAPYQPPEPYRSMYHPEVQVDDAGSGNHMQRTRRLLQADDPTAAANNQTLIALYQGGVSWVDAEVGRLLDGLRTRGVLDDALVIVTSDHGEAFNTHEELWGHGETVYDESVWVPLMVRLPGAWRGGSVVSGEVSSIDLFSSVLELLGFDVPPVEAVSWVPALRGDLHPPARGAVYSEGTKPRLTEDRAWHNDAMQKSAREDGWTYVLTPHTRTSALFHDAAQRIDHAADAPEMASALRSRLARWRSQARPLPTQRTTDERVKLELELLGYTEATAPPTDATQPVTKETEE